MQRGWGYLALWAHRFSAWQSALILAFDETSSSFDQRAGHHIVQGLFLIGEWLHGEAKSEQNSGSDSGGAVGIEVLVRFLSGSIGDHYYPVN